MKVWKTAIEADTPENIEPGKVLSVDEEGILVKAGIDAIRLFDFAPRFQLQQGDYL